MEGAASALASTTTDSPEIARRAALRQRAGGCPRLGSRRPRRSAVPAPDDHVIGRYMRQAHACAAPEEVAVRRRRRQLSREFDGRPPHVRAGRSGRREPGAKTRRAGADGLGDVVKRGSCRIASQRHTNVSDGDESTVVDHCRGRRNCRVAISSFSQALEPACRDHALRVQEHDVGVTGDRRRSARSSRRVRRAPQPASTRSSRSGTASATDPIPVQADRRSRARRRRRSVTGPRRPCGRAPTGRRRPIRRLRSAPECKPGRRHAASRVSTRP